MSELGPGGLVRLVAMHAYDPSQNADKVWAGLVQRQAVTGGPTQFRFVSVWGRRGRPLNMRPGAWTSLNDVDRRFERMREEKAREDPPYQEVDWDNPRYGMVETIRELMPPTSRMRDVTPAPEPGDTKRASEPRPKASPSFQESPRLRLRRERKLE